MEQVRRQPTADDAADDADDDIHDDAVAVAAHKAPRERPGNAANDDRSQPTDSFHAVLHESRCRKFICTLFRETCQRRYQR